MLGKTNQGWRNDEGGHEEVGNATQRAAPEHQTTNFVNVLPATPNVSGKATATIATSKARKLCHCGTKDRNTAKSSQNNLEFANYCCLHSCLLS